MKAKRRTMAVVFTMLALLMWLLTALFTWSALGNTWYGWVSQDWPIAEGQVLDIRVEEVITTVDNPHWSPHKQDVARTIQRTRYRPVVEYQWRANGQTFQRDRRNFSAAVAYEKTREAAEAIIAPYVVGAAVDIHYDPGEPSRGILEPGPIWDGFGVALFVAVFCLAFALLFSLLALWKFH